MSDLVRAANPEDADGIFDLCVRLHEENGQHPMAPDKVRAMIHRGVHRQNAIIGVIGNVGDLRASVFLGLDTIWYSNEFQLMEMWNYVVPEHRRSDYAKQLIRFAIRCSDETGLDLSMGIVSNIQTEAKVRLYERHLPAVGVFFVKHPNEPFRARDPKQPRFVRRANEAAAHG